MMRWFKLLPCLVIACFALACGPNGELVGDAIDAGNLKEAERLLREMPGGEEQRYYGGRLIDEYLAIDKIDKAINVFDNITGHCSMFHMQYKLSYENAEYTLTYSAKIYNALLKAGRYEEAWNYHCRSYNSETYPGNAPDYFAYMTDVIVAMSRSGRSVEIPGFVRDNSLWFLKNVDNNEWGEKYPNFRYDIMRGELNKIVNETMH